MSGFFLFLCNLYISSYLYNFAEPAIAAVWLLFIWLGENEALTTCPELFSPNRNYYVRGERSHNFGELRNKWGLWFQCGYLEGIRSHLGGWTQRVKSWYWGNPLVSQDDILFFSTKSSAQSPQITFVTLLWVFV